LARPGFTHLIAADAGGTPFGTIRIAGVDYPAVCLVDADAHVIGSRPDWSTWYDLSTIASNLEIGELFNTSTSIVRVRGIWVVPSNVSITTGFQLIIDINRITTVGTTSSLVVTPRPYDTLQGTTYPLPAGLTARHRTASGSGAALAYKYWSHYLWYDEMSPGMPPAALTNQIPTYGDRVSEFVLRQNEGIQVKLGTVSGAAGTIGCKIDFVVDN
jgi:hypothetical protein